MSQAEQILNSQLIRTIIYLGSSSHLSLGISASKTHASKVKIHTHKPNTRHNDNNVVEI
uniref:Uncharacterized protein n=1 Tax=Mesocestoides corti TaxID=53468 RepID=A0A5K3FXC4_MESCO